MTNQIADYVELKLASTFTPTTDSTIDLVETNSIYGLTNQKTAAIFQTLRLSLFEKTDTTQKLTVGIISIVANGTLGGLNRYTATIQTSDGANPMIGLANVDDGTDDDDNIIAGNVTGLTVDGFSTDSVVLLKVGSAEYTELLNAFNTNVATRFAQFFCFDKTTDVTVGDGRAFFQVPAKFDSSTISIANATVLTAGTTGSSTIQIYNETNAADVLSTPITILSAATTGAGVIDIAEAAVSTGDILRVDVDTVSTTEPKGLLVNIEFSN